jgi:enoyl-CoA hydratase
MKTISYRQAEGLAIVTLNTPPLNLVSLEMTQELSDLLAKLEADPSVRGLLVTGSGQKAFCAGSDIKEFDDYMVPGAVIEKKLARENAMYTQLANFRTPTVAAVQGLAFGGGLELAVCCDIIVAAESARFALPEVKLGVFPGSGGTVRVQRRVGYARALEMTVLGDPITSENALSWGLVNRVVPDDQLAEKAEEIATRIAQGPLSQNLAKSALHLAAELPEDAAIKGAMDLIDRAFNSSDCRAGVDAFRARQKPQFFGK